MKLDFNNIVGLDFETYSDVDLQTHGLHRYVNSPHFRPLLASVSSLRVPGSSVYVHTYDLVTNDFEEEWELLVKKLEGKLIVAHNAGFEQAVLERMGVSIPSEQFIDSAVLARMAGAAGKLEAAAPQLLGFDKLAAGVELIKLFCVPGPYQEAMKTQDFVPDIVVDNPTKWGAFITYCEIDSELGLKILENTTGMYSDREHKFNALTMDMNKTGWFVDMELVNRMQEIYESNVANSVSDFRADTGDLDLNLNSPIQLRAWCAQRGVRAKSFDEQHVASLLTRVNKQLLKPDLPADKRANYSEVQHLLQTKQILGGSSLKKLQTIINTVGSDSRLHDQYMHVGAGATFRTTGRGVQMQNLPRLNGGGSDVDELSDHLVMWDNHKLSANLRQVFMAEHPDGFLIVGDFASVESRGLAWQAGELWKLNAYFRGEDLYIVQARMMLGLHDTTEVSKDHRQLGKVGELSCGYGAGGEAVQGFAAKMGLTLSEGEAAQLVRDWRSANPRIENYWHRLNEALHMAISNNTTVSIKLMTNGFVHISPMGPPQSLKKQDPNTVSLEITMVVDSRPVLTRVIHGCHIVGRNIRYYKPSERKSGDLWSSTFVDQKTKQRKAYTVYGGKLAGLLTQSMCRELFFLSLENFAGWADPWPNVKLVGQFHDEIVVEWSPGPVSLEATKAALETAMTSTLLPDFPLAAEIKHDKRYTK